MLKKYLIYIFILLLAAVANAQKDSLAVKYDTSSPIEKKAFNKEHLDTYKADKEFDYEVEKRQITLLEKIVDWFKRILLKILGWIFGVERATGILSFIFRILPYAIGVVVLFLLVKFFLKVNVKSMVQGNKNIAVVTLSEEEELIKNEDINILINNAIEAENYRLAIRYYYLLILQKLSNRNLIGWEQQKTNEDYINEIREETLKNKFIAGTYLYDFIWYGNFELDKIAFLKAQNKFTELTNLIK